jgi:hypothetical protein
VRKKGAVLIKMHQREEFTPTVIVNNDNLPWLSRKEENAVLNYYSPWHTTVSREREEGAIFWIIRYLDTINR